MFTEYRSPDRQNHRKIRIESFYLPMRDGVRLAVDVLFPSPAPSGKQFPVLLHQTRYWRLPELRKPFSWFSQGLLGHEAGYVKELVLSGYIFVNVDCRGSGASFGSRPYPWSPDEIKDGAEVVEWILQQPWASGEVGSVGISYTGTAAETLLVNQHPAVKACMALFSLYDVYDDIACPFGIPHENFLREWGRANAMLDENRLPISELLAKLLVRGVKPVGKRAELKQALAEHKDNLHVSDTSRGIIFRDQAPDNGIIESMDGFSPHFMQEQIDGSGAAMYSVSGWFDGAYPHSAIRRFLNSGASTNKLLLGPWDHGAKHHITPGGSRKLGAESVREGIKYFDFQLKGYENGIQDEPRVRYFTMQEEAWKTAETWPPPGTLTQACYLHENGQLSPELPPAGNSSDILKADSRQGTGKDSRWYSLLSKVKTHKYYPDRRERDKLLTCYDSQPLDRNTEVTGHPIATIFLRTQEDDASIFVYLEEVLPDGQVLYVTEGGLRALHRQISATSEYQDVVPQRTYRQEMSAPIVPNEVTRLEFDLLPTSYMFRKGSRIRIALATGDADVFEKICADGSEYEVLRTAEFPSGVLLPVMGD
jgi:hypothetical protein